MISKLYILVVFCIISIKLSSSQVLNINENEGIDISPVNASFACNTETQPLIVKAHFGYINTLNFDGFHYYPSNTNCSWLLIAEEMNTFVIRFNVLELDYNYKDGLYLYDGYNASAPLIGHYSGSQRKLPNYRSPGKVLYIRFAGIEQPRTVGFLLYFEQKPIPIHCKSDQKTCRNNITCFQVNQICDGIDDCEDGTDEQNCSSKIYSPNFPNECGQPKIKPDQNFLRIVGGHKVIPGSWPWMVSMRLPAHEPDGHTCGASVLNRQWLLTAAHCFNEVPNPHDWQIHLGKYQKLVRDKSEVIRYIDSIYIHPNYKGNQSLPPNKTSWFEQKANDIALIKLNAPLPVNNSFIGAVCLPESSEELSPNTMCYVTGWGATYLTGDDLVLKQAKVPIISNKQCREWMPYFNIGESMICAGYEAGGQDSCQGDSGGPLVRFNTKTNSYEIVGIVSTGGPCGGKKLAGIYTKASHFVLWIEETIAKHQKVWKSEIIKTLLNEWYNLLSDENF